MGLDVVQLPSNVFDRRAEQAGVFDLAGHLDKTLYIRSVFLQGALVMNEEKLKGCIPAVRLDVEKFQGICKQFGLTPTRTALVFVRDRLHPHRVLFGAETPEQVHENLKSWASPLPVDALSRIIQDFAEVPEEIIDPRRW